MTISKEILDELLKGVERPEDLLGDAGLMKDGLGRLQNAVQPPQHHLAVLRLLAITPEEFGDRPDETAERLDIAVAHS